MLIIFSCRKAFLIIIVDITTITLTFDDLRLGHVPRISDLYRNNVFLKYGRVEIRCRTKSHTLWVMTLKYISVGPHLLTIFTVIQFYLSKSHDSTRFLSTQFHLAQLKWSHDMTSSDFGQNSQISKVQGQYIINFIASIFNYNEKRCDSQWIFSKVCRLLDRSAVSL